MMLPGDTDAVKGARLQKSAVRRAWGFARPYRAIIVIFLVTIFASALVELVPPFAFRAIIDKAAELGVRFIDSDDEIVKAAGLTVERDEHGLIGRGRPRGTASAMSNSMGTLSSIKFTG